MNFNILFRCLSDYSILLIPNITATDEAKQIKLDIRTSLIP